MDRQDKIVASGSGLWLGFSTMVAPVVATTANDVTVSTPVALAVSAVGGVTAIISWGCLQKSLESKKDTDREA